MIQGFANPATKDFVIGVTQVLIDKKKDRASWSPSTIDDSSLTPIAIDSRFFDLKSRHLTDRPELDLKPVSTSRVTAPYDSTWGRFRRYGLPSEAEVEAAVKGSSPGSGAFKITEAELIERLVEARGDAGGPRHKEVEEVIRRSVRRLCDVKEGYLDWKR